MHILQPQHMTTPYHNIYIYVCLHMIPYTEQENNRNNIINEKNLAIRRHAI